MARHSSALECWSAALTKMAERLVNKIREERDKLGWTQAELAARVGVSRKTVNTIENGIFVPSTPTALKLAQALILPVEELFWLES